MLIEAYSKVNLFLDVLGKRSDGYHEIATVLVPLELHDEVEVVETAEGILIECDDSAVPCGESNNAWQAAARMYSAAGFSERERGALIKIKKRIPVAGGLGGSATDAAAVITALNKIWDLKLSGEELVEIASKVGADVPFFLFNKPAYATGIGEKLSFIKLPEVHFVIAIPAFDYFTGKHKTKELYKQVDAMQRRPMDVESKLVALKRGSVKEIASLLENAFESIAFEHASKLKAVKEKLLECGALNACLAGAGPALFAVAKNKEQALEIAGKIKALPDVKQVFATTSLSSASA